MGTQLKEYVNLQKVRICAKPMRISVHNAGAAPSSGDSGKKKDFSGDKRIISRDVTNKRTADTQQPQTGDSTEWLLASVPAP